MRNSNPLQIAVLIFLATGLVSEVQAEARTFHSPLFEGYRLDYCKATGRACGERVATEWCVAQGYEYASDWGIADNIGDILPTISFDTGAVCRDGQCDGFSEITCGREGEAFSLPSLGGDTRATVFTPDRRHAASAVTREEVKLTVPGCSQIRPSVLDCHSEPEYQYCRTLLQDGYVLGCRVAIAIDSVLGDSQEAPTSDYELSLRPRASITVEHGSRGEGQVRGEIRYSVEFTQLPTAIGDGECQQRDRYEFYQTGPDGGSSEIFAAEDCADPMEGRFSPHDDDLLLAYDLCEGRRAWGDSIEMTSDVIVAAIFHSSAAANGSTETGLVSPYITVEAPVEIRCND
jgi:hypothetical protein